MPARENSRDPNDIAAENVSRRALGVVLKSTGSVKASQGELSAPTQFMPRIPTRALREFVRLVEAHHSEDLARALRRVATDASRTDDVAHKSIYATALLLSDLIRLGWSVDVAEGSIWLAAPRSEALPGEDLQEVKRRLRAPLVAARATQLADPAVRAFFRRVETPRMFKGQRVSIADLVDNGEALASELRRVALLQDSARAMALNGIVRPTLHLATADERCPHTDLPLLEVYPPDRHHLAGMMRRMRQRPGDARGAT